MNPLESSFRPAALLLAVLALALLSGCSLHTGIKPALPTQIAACVLVDRLPQSAGYLTAAAGVFHACATATNLPTPAAVRAALAALPNAKLTPAQQELLWGATVLAYELAQRAARTPADFLALRGALDEIAGALLAAVKECGPPTPLQSPGKRSHTAQSLRPPSAVDEQGLYDLSRVIGKRLTQ